MKRHFGAWHWASVYTWAVTGSCALLAFPANAAIGEYWEITSKMEIPGMPMAIPASTTKVCLPKGNERDPRYSADKECSVTDVRTSGNKTSWKMQCNGKDGVMTGVGESSATADSQEGKIRLTGTSGGEPIDMTQTYRTKRLGGACDTDEMNKKAKEAMAAADKSLAQMCDTSAYTTRDWINRASLFIEAKPTCTGKKDALCQVVRRDVVRNVDDYIAYKNDGAGSKIAAACGLPFNTARSSICKVLDANNSDVRRQLRSSVSYKFMQAECPAEMKVYAEVNRKRFCEGRDFTARKQVSMADCLTGVGSDSEAPDQEAAATKTVDSNAAAPAQNGLVDLPNLTDSKNPAGAILDGAKKLKNIFGF